MRALILIFSLIGRFEFIALTLFVNNKKFKFYYFDIVIFYILIILSLIMVFTPYNSYYMKLYSLLTLFTAWIVWKQKINVENFLFVALITFYIFFLLVAIASFLDGISVRLAFHIVGVFLGFSVNYILSFFSIFLVYFVLRFHYSFRNETFFISSLFLIILTESRFFSIAALILLISRYSTKTKTYFYLATAFILITSFVFHFSYEAFDSRLFQRGLEDTRRMAFLSCYLENLSIYTLLFGLSFDDCPSIIDARYNPHNSLIKFHSMYGIVGIFCVVSWSFFIMYHSIKYSFKLFFLFLIVYFLRFFIDSFYLFTLLDLMVILVLVALKDRQLFHRR